MAQASPSRGALYSTWFHVLMLLTIVGFIAYDLVRSGRIAGSIVPVLILISPAIAAVLVSELCRRTRQPASLTWILSLATLIMGAGMILANVLDALSG